jgi:hypothetical protein
MSLSMRQLILALFVGRHRRRAYLERYFISFLLLVLVLTPAGVRGQEVLNRKAGESTKNFANRILPPKTELAHKILMGSFGPSSNNILLLFRPALDSSNYTGWVLMPQDNSFSFYQKVVLPPMEEIPQHFDISVSSVLFANADKDKELELIILYEYYRTGSGNATGNAAYVYDWSGREFVVLDKIGAKLVGLKTAAAVRRKLKALGQ